MTTQKKPFSAVVSIATAPLAALMFFAFVQKTPAQVYKNRTITADKTARAKQNTKAGLSKSVTSANSKSNTPDTKPATHITTVTEKPESSKRDTVRPVKEAQFHVADRLDEAVQPKMLDQKPAAHSPIIPAEFPGGIPALRKALAANTDVSKITPRKEPYSGKIVLNVWNDGKAADTFFDFKDQEFLKVMSDALSKTLKDVQWKPATKDGVPVDYIFEIPVTMSINR